MSDAMIMIYGLWVLYGIAVWTKPEVFQPLLWAVGVGTIFLTLLGMMNETAQSAQQKIMAEVRQRHLLEKIGAENKARRDYEEWKAAQAVQPVEKWNEQGSYYVDGLGKRDR